MMIKCQLCSAKIKGSVVPAALALQQPTRNIDLREERPRLQAVQNVICGYVIHEGDDMTMRQVAALVQLANEPKQVTELAKELRLSNSTTSRIIDVLEKLKYVKRQRDGRNVTVTILQRGMAKVGRLMAKT